MWAGMARSGASIRNPLPRLQQRSQSRLVRGRLWRQRCARSLRKSSLRLQVVAPESGSDRRAVFSYPGVAGPVQVKQVWFPLQSVSLPAWQVYLPLAPLRTYWVVVDDDSSEILFSLNLTREGEPPG